MKGQAVKASHCPGTNGVYTSKAPDLAGQPGRGFAALEAHASHWLSAKCLLARQQAVPASVRAVLCLQ